MQSKSKIIKVSEILEKLREKELLIRTREISPKTLFNSMKYPITDTRELEKRADTPKETSSFLPYICIEGTVYDGHTFIGQAVQSGIRLFIVEKEQKRDDIMQIIVKDSRKTLAVISNLFFDYPSSKLFMIGITGTNGKTSILRLIESVLSKLGKSVGSIGTLGYMINGEHHELERTTPDIKELHSILDETVLNGVQYVIMEVSSHALKLNRVFELKYNLAIFTNLTRDHLDFHPDMEDYYLGKKMLFDNLNGPALINTDDSYGARLFSEFTGEKYAISTNNYSNSDIRYKIHQSNLFETRFQLEFKGDYREKFVLQRANSSDFIIETPLLGSHNAFNITAALAAVNIITETFSDDTIAHLPDRLCGRLERVKNDIGLACFIDYAHTPEAIISVCKTIKEGLENTGKNNHKKGRIICVIGAGGDRDRGKRKEMTDAAFRYADLVIITTDNPRKENPADIICDMVQDYDPISNYWIAIDRRTAIEIAVSLAQIDDAILITGKGHEKYQEFSRERISFDDYKIAQQAIAKRVMMVKTAENLSDQTDINGYSPATIEVSIPLELMQVRLLLENNDYLAEELSWGRKKEEKQYRISRNQKRIEKLRSEGLTIDRKLFTAVSTDTRTIKDNTLFIALKGNTFNGHDYVESALANRSNWAIVAQDFPPYDNPDLDRRIIRVKSTIKAYATLAKKYRNLFHATLIAITGSSGKTTTKEYCSNILSVTHRVLKNIANENNLLGVAKTLFRLSPSHDYAVLEIGSNQVGEIELLADTCQPDIGMVINIGPSHLEFFHDLNGVFKEKSALLKRDLILRFIPGDDDFFSHFNDQYIRVSLADDSHHNNKHYHVEIISQTRDMSIFKIEGNTYSISSGTRFNVLNAAFAIVLARAVGLESESIQA